MWQEAGQDACGERKKSSRKALLMDSAAAAALHPSKSPWTSEQQKSEGKDCFVLGTPALGYVFKYWCMVATILLFKKMKSKKRHRISNLWSLVATTVKIKNKQSTEGENSQVKLQFLKLGEFGVWNVCDFPLRSQMTFLIS